jgi:hypothetical protein
MDPMSAFLNGPVEPPNGAALQSVSAPFTARCTCGRAWNVTMERGESGQHGCIRCTCNAELISWSGTVVFSAFPID